MNIIHERIVMRKFFQAFLLILTCLSRWQAFATDFAPFTDHQVRAVRNAIGLTKIQEWKSQAGTDWDAIAILNQAKQWPGIQSDAVNAANPLNYGLRRVYDETHCSSLKEFTARLTAGILLGNGFKDGVVNVHLKVDELTTYRDAVRDLSQHFTSATLSEAHFRATGSTGSVRGHVDAVNSLFATARKTDPITLVIPGAPVTLVSTSPAGQAIAKRYVDSELSADHAIYPKCDHTEIVLEGPPIGSIEAAVKYDNPAVVVFANKNPIHFGTRPDDAAMDANQERCIFRCTDLTDQLSARKNSFWPFDQTGGVYASGINIVRTASTTRASFQQDHPQGHPIGLIFSAAPSSGVPSATDSAAVADYRKLINKIVEHQFIMAIMNGHDTLITGNFGLGIFNNDGDVVADAYIKCLQKFDRLIARVVFTYLDPNNIRQPEVAKFGQKMLAAKALIERDRGSES